MLACPMARRDVFGTETASETCNYMSYTAVAKSDIDPLEKPLLDSDHDSTGSGVMSTGSSTEDLAKSGNGSKSNSSKYNEYMAGRIYASNAPKIFLETITARTATLIIALTYFFFILGFCVDFYTTYKSFHSSNYQLSALPCGEPDLNQTENYESCSSGNYWNATITELSNVISVKLDVKQENVSLKLLNATEVFDVKYNIDLWACYSEHGCGTQFASNSYYTNDPNTWQHVYLKDNVNMRVDTTVDLEKEGNDVKSLTKSIVPSLFQNQESIPTNGLVKSYFISLEYTYNPYNLFIETEDINNKNESMHATYYYFDVVERPRQESVNIVTVLLLITTVSVLIWYVHMLSQQKKVLSEQKWVVGYFALLVLFQNPVYCVIVFYSNSPTVQEAYVSYVIGYIAQAGLFVLWLLFADSIHRKTTNKRIFYGPKVFMGLVIFTFSIVILTFQFPGLNADRLDHARSAVQAVANWTPRLRIQFIVFTIMYLMLIWLWTMWWFINLYLTGLKLKKLPYMSTRYIQLSYRFFSLQATLVTLYYLFQYVVVIVFITQGVNSSNYDSVTLTDNINILFRQQTQLFGKTLFLTVYALIIAFLFLPSSLMSNQQGLMASLSATYVITEQEHRILVKTRKILIGSAKRNLINQLSIVNQLTGAKADVFCVELALNLRNVAFQAYYDPPRITTASAYGEMNLDPIGYEFIDLTYNAEHEVFCFICREREKGRLVVAFRGTASKKQMEANLKYTQRAIVFSDLTTNTLDHLDGLAIKPADEEMDNRFELDSVSDDEQDEADLGLESAHGGAGATTSNSRRWGVGASAGAGAFAGWSSGGSSRMGSGNNTQTGEDNMAHRESTAGESSSTVGRGLKRVLQGAADVTLGVVDRAGAVVDTAAGLVTTAAVGVASKTPVLKNIVTVKVHSGFWEAYEHVRDFIHAILRKELVRNPTTVYFTGHSLGGALATFAALDVTLHTLPRVNAWLKHQQKLKMRRESDLHEGMADARPSMFSAFSRTFTDTLAPIHNFATSAFMPRASTFQPDQSSHGLQGSPQHPPSVKPAPFVRKIKIFMYNYGSPKVGNGNFVKFYDKTVPCSYRVVVDGDIVPALPPQSNYTHVGTEILIDSMGAGSIIIDPSFVERWLRTHMKSSVAVHSLLVYRKGLLGIKLAAEFMRANAGTVKGVDPLRLALTVRTHQQVDSILDENAGIAIDLETRDAESDFGGSFVSPSGPPSIAASGRPSFVAPTAAAGAIATAGAGAVTMAGGERQQSVSDEISARIPCTPPLDERHLQETASELLLLNLLSPEPAPEASNKEAEALMDEADEPSAAELMNLVGEEAEDENEQLQQDLKGKLKQDENKTAAAGAVTAPAVAEEDSADLEMGHVVSAGIEEKQEMSEEKNEEEEEEEEIAVGRKQVVSFKAGGVTTTINPLSRKISAAIPPPARAVTADRANAASHYAHDVEYMAALQSQLSSMRIPGPVRWLQEQTARKPKKGAAAEMPKRPDGSMKRDNKRDKEAFASGMDIV